MCDAWRHNHFHFILYIFFLILFISVVNSEECLCFSSISISFMVREWQYVRECIDIRVMSGECVCVCDAFCGCRSFSPIVIVACTVSCERKLNVILNLELFLECRTDAGTFNSTRLSFFLSLSLSFSSFFSFASVKYFSIKCAIMPWTIVLTYYRTQNIFSLHVFVFYGIWHYFCCSASCFFLSIADCKLYCPNSHSKIFVGLSSFCLYRQYFCVLAFFYCRWSKYKVSCTFPFIHDMLSFYLQYLLSVVFAKKKTQNSVLSCKYNDNISK